MRKKGYIIHSKKGFLVDQTRKINQLISDSKIYQAETIVNSLLEKYPNDFGLYEIKARIHSLMGEYSEALEWLNNCEEHLVFFKKTVVALKLKDYSLLKELYYKYFRDKNYDRDIALVWPNNYINFQYIKIYLTKLFEPERLKDYRPETYVLNQLVEYNLDSSLEHIKNRHLLHPYNGSSYFTKDFDFSYWIPEIKKIIEANPDKALVSNYQEEYIFRLQGCGYDPNHNLVNYFLVATIFNTSDILTMYPFRPQVELNTIELSKPEELEIPDVKVKKLSQSDKFNKRYGIK